MNKFFFILLSFISFPILSQEFEKEMKDIVSKLDTSTSVLIEVKVDVYRKKGGDLIYTTSSSVKHSGKITITKLDNFEMYKSQYHDIQVDHEDRKMLVHKINTSQKTNDDFSDLNLKEIKALLKSETKDSKKPIYTLKSNEKSLKTYSITNIPGLKECIIVLDTKNEKIISVTYEYSEKSAQKGQYCVIEYSTFDYTPNFSPSIFELKNYFTYVDKKCVLSKKFKTYQLFTE